MCHRLRRPGIAALRFGLEGQKELTLEEVGYPADADLAAQVERASAKRVLPDG